MRVRTRSGSDLTFGANRGRITGWTGTVISAAGGVLVLTQDHSIGACRGAIALVLFALVTWANLIRPRIEVSDGTIRLINSFTDIMIPTAAVTGVAVRTFLSLEVGPRSYASASIGHSARSMLRGDADLARGMRLEPGRPPVVENYVAYVRERLEQITEQARIDAVGEPAPVTRSLAVLPCALAAVLTAALVVALLL
ncbi:MAG: hypothetical protein JWP74_1959 [Marmoricola sp.]|nr:hypothetical protein [Marmoricola sp.]